LCALVISQVATKAVTAYCIAAHFDFFHIIVLAVLCLVLESHPLFDACFVTGLH